MIILNERKFLSSNHNDYSYHIAQFYNSLQSKQNLFIKNEGQKYCIEQKVYYLCTAKSRKIIL